MSAPSDSTLVILSAEPVEIRIASALQSAARALGYADGCDIVQLADTPDLKRCVFERDPWVVMAVDDASIAALRVAFSLEAQDFGADDPACIAGYKLIAVPGFATCLDNQETKRVAWRRMKVAAHPGNPLD